MAEIIRLTREIHYFMRGKLSWEKSIWLLEEIVDSEDWLQHLEIGMLLYEIAMENQEKGNTLPFS
jgi:hypothetical protein